MKINPYLTFNGKCEEAFKFYEKCFGGTIVAMFPHGEVPTSEQVPEDWHTKIMHAQLMVGDNAILGSDNPPQHFSEPQGFYVSVSIDTPEEADRVFHILAENGNVRMPIMETFWALRFGMLVDQFGTPWMINCHKPNF